MTLTDPFEQVFLDKTSAFNLQELSKGNSGRSLDVVLSNYPETILNVSTNVQLNNLFSSDHPPVSVKLQLK